MYSIKQLSKKANVSIRTLHYYDEIGLLCPKCKTESNYRLYDDENLERLKLILLFKELQFPLEEIKEILDNNKDLEAEIKNQISVLNEKKEYIESLITFAKKYKQKGKVDMKNDYSKEALDKWGDSEEYREYQNKKLNSVREEIISEGLMNILKEFHTLKNIPVSSKNVQSLVEKYRDYISKNFYSCSNEMLLILAQMYIEDKRFLNNINNTCGDGTAEFVFEAVNEYCKQKG